MNNKETYKTMSSFRSIRHTMYTQLLKKLVLKNLDDKRCYTRIEGSAPTSLPWGHYKNNE